MLPTLTVACYSFAEPSLRPGDSRDIMDALARHGVVVSDVIAGESACDDPSLIANALHLVAVGPDDPDPRDVFIYPFRVRGWEGSAKPWTPARSLCGLAGRWRARATGRRADVSGVRRGLVERPDRGGPRRARGGIDEGHVSDLSEPILSSRHSPRFREALALREARARRERGLLLVDGGREIGRALAAGVAIAGVWVAREQVRTDEGRQALAAVEATGAPVIEATPELLARLAYGERDDGIVAVGGRAAHRSRSPATPAEPLVVVIEGVEKPGNLGAVIRSADGAGSDAVIVADPSSDPWNPNAIRASTGTVFSVPLAVCASADARAYLDRTASASSRPTPTATGHTTRSISPVRSRCVLGAEAAGLSKRGGPTTWPGSASRCWAPRTASTSRRRRPCSSSRRAVNGVRQGARPSVGT